MGKSSIPFIFLILLCSAFSCQEHEQSYPDIAQISDGFGEHVQHPYGFSFHAKYFPHPSDIEEELSFVLSGEHLSQSGNSSCDFGTVSLNEYTLDVFFQKRGGGLIHTLNQPEEGELPAWECDSISARSSAYPAPVNIFPHGGWNVFAQAQAMIQEMGHVVTSVNNGEVILTWDSVDPDLSKAMLGQHHVPGWGEETGVQSVSLGVDIDSGLPSSMKVLLENGDSLETQFINFSLLGSSYNSKMRDLRSKMAVPESILCGCDGPIYEVTTQPQQ